MNPRSAWRLRDGTAAEAALLREPCAGALAPRRSHAPDAHERRPGYPLLARLGGGTDAHLIKIAMARVVMACALEHHTRRIERDPERWQMASQLVTTPCSAMRGPLSRPKPKRRRI